MNTQGNIRVIVLAAIVRPSDHALLVFRGYNSRKAQTFYRPLGGGVEFGETSQQALQREIQEELGVAVRPVRKLATLESIFVHEGAPGHEIVIVWLAEFTDPALYLEETLPYTEGGRQSVALWVIPSRLQAQGIPLYPSELTELLQGV
ncbi:MAG TPA: NUDIX hydrolase [Chloroflexi bacterium]|nr:NUDIX hydrolase [Chloroflexota bacterium]